MKFYNVPVAPYRNELGNTITSIDIEANNEDDAAIKVIGLGKKITGRIGETTNPMGF